MIAEAASVLAAAKQPLIIAGSGAARSGAEAELRELAKVHNIPVLGHVLGRGLVPEDGKHGFPWPFAQVAAKNADVVLAVGARLTQSVWATHGLAPRYRADAKIIKIDICAEELARNRVSTVALHGDAKPTLAKLVKALPPSKRGEATWLHEAIRRHAPRASMSLGRAPDGPIHPLRLGRELMDVMPEDAIFVGDGADILNWMHSIVRIRTPRSYLDHYPMGSMGIGTLLRPRRGRRRRKRTRRRNRAASRAAWCWSPATVRSVSTPANSIPSRWRD